MEIMALAVSILAIATAIGFYVMNGRTLRRVRNIRRETSLMLAEQRLAGVPSIELRVRLLHAPAGQDILLQQTARRLHYVALYGGTDRRGREWVDILGGPIFHTDSDGITGKGVVLEVRPTQDSIETAETFIGRVPTFALDPRNPNP